MIYRIESQKVEKRTKNLLPGKGAYMKEVKSRI
jgi:hypothetical protein